MAESLNKLAFLCCFCLSTLPFSHASDPILPNQSLPDGKFIVSSNGAFEMGFFSPDNSKNRFFGIWYKVISTGTVLWVANRDSPLNDTSGALTLTQDGNLIVRNTTNRNVFWSSRGNYTSNIQNPVAQLLGSGNLVIRDAKDENTENYLWQSFDHPSDTALPGMKIGKNLVTGLDRVLRSWKNGDDPSMGSYSYLLDSHGFPQLFLMGSGSVERFRFGPWNGETFSGAPTLKKNQIYTLEFVFNREEIYYTFHPISSSVFVRLVLNHSGRPERSSWNHRTQAWTNLLTRPNDDYDNYRNCYGYGICDINSSPVCSCLDKFKPQNEEDWWEE
ncbi:Non-specific serine/threonine protein kinase [Handroanthus impetiginosus]|uniref:Non-specific serine/threonine protein kinase n=1 Tax=Handroanthus impetiginosus TaxID=429701 RepID=A0A2G9GZQ9_9LAMI|nr:Non-specific serine/threonine protein kinase [Handroanthus impetiginosus]